MQILLLAGVAVLIVAYAVGVRPMQAEIDELLMSLESESAAAAGPSVDPAAAVFLTSAERALPRFYSEMENHMKSAGLDIVSRQARIEADPRFPATSIIFECRARGKWPSVTRFFSAVRASRPRIQMRRIIIQKLERPQQVELFYEAAALAMEGAG